MNIIVPLGGKGERFYKEGFNLFLRAKIIVSNSSTVNGLIPSSVAISYSIF